MVITTVADAVQVETLVTANANDAVKNLHQDGETLHSKVVVTVGLDASNTIVSLTIGGLNFAETAHRRKPNGFAISSSANPGY